MSLPVENNGVPLHSGKVAAYDGEFPEFKTRASNYDRDVKPARLQRAAKALIITSLAIFVLGTGALIGGAAIHHSLRLAVIGSYAGAVVVAAGVALGGCALSEKASKAVLRSDALKLVSDTFQKVGNEKTLVELINIIRVSKREFGENLNGLTPTEKFVVTIAERRLAHYLRGEVNRSSDANLNVTSLENMKKLISISNMLPEQSRIERMNTTASRKFLDTVAARTQ